MNRHRSRRTSLVALALAVAALTAPRSAEAQASVYVTNLDPLYEDLDALIAAGLIPSAISAQRPYSRVGMRTYAAEARRHISRFPLPRFTEALARLEAALAAPTKRALRSALLDVTGAESPDRRVPTSYGSRTATGLTPSYIDASLNPLLQRNQGRVIANGATLGAEAVMEAELGAHFAAQLHPRLWAGAGSGRSVFAEATLQEGYIRALFGNFAIDAGRNHVAVGYGSEAGPMLSHNARGLDLVRVSVDHPVPAGWLGTADLSVLFADMGRNDDVKHSIFGLGAATVHPHPNLELGVTFVNHFGGEGVAGSGLRNRLEDFFLVFPQAGDIVSDKVAGGSIRVIVPSVRLQLWVDGMTTDIQWPIKYWDQALGTEAVWTGGARMTGFGAEGRTDVWMEARRSGVRPYTHHQYTSGLALDDRILGDAIGPLAKAFTLGLERRERSQTFTLAGTWERYSGGDRYTNFSENEVRWIRTLDEPDEVRFRVIGGWKTDPTASRLGTSLRVGYEYVERFNFSSITRSNVLAQVGLEYRL